MIKRKGNIIKKGSIETEEHYEYEDELSVRIIKMGGFRIKEFFTKGKFNFIAINLDEEESIFIKNGEISFFCIGGYNIKVKTLKTIFDASKIRDAVALLNKVK